MNLVSAIFSKKKGKKQAKTRKKVMRFKENPFTEDMFISRKEKRIKLSRLGQDDNVVVNQATGEFFGTHVTSFREVDEAKFVKLFVQNITLTFDLTSPGVKTLNFLIWQVQRSALCKDKVALDKSALEEFIEEKKVQFSIPTLTRGLGELVNASIIARTTRKGDFFINPNFVFNGDRIVFSNAIQKRKSIAEPANKEINE